jgi:hypothetical protein
MEEQTLFSMVRSSTAALCITILLLMTVGEINEFFFPYPPRGDYITVIPPYECITQADKAQEEVYKQQCATFEEVKKNPNKKRFLVRSSASSLFLITAVTLSTTALGTAFMAAGTVGLCYAFIEHGGGLPTSIRLIFLLMAIGLLCFFLYRWGRKEN